MPPQTPQPLAIRNINGGRMLDDHWATDYALPGLDARQDKTLLSAMSLPLPAEECGRGSSVSPSTRHRRGACIHDEYHAQEDASIMRRVAKDEGDVVVSDGASKQGKKRWNDRLGTH